MKTILLSILLLLSSAKSSETYVYICTGPKSECYNKTKDCRGLQNCSREIIKVSLSDAKEKYHRRSCGYCYR